MSLIPWTRRDIIPTQFRTLRDELDEFFSPLFESMPTYVNRPTRAFVPLVDVREDDKVVTVTAELPGIDKEDVDIQIDGETLIIRGERREEIVSGRPPITAEASSQGQQSSGRTQASSQGQQSSSQGQQSSGRAQASSQGQQSSGQGQQSSGQGQQSSSQGQQASGQMQVSGQQQPMQASGQSDWWRREISYGAFVRRITLPCEVDPSQTEATMHNGILTIHMAKATGSKAKSIQIR